LVTMAPSMIVTFTSWPILQTTPPLLPYEM